MFQTVSFDNDFKRLKFKDKSEEKVSQLMRSALVELNFETLLSNE